MYCVWWRIRHRAGGSYSTWSCLVRGYTSESAANAAVAVRARQSGVAVEYLVLPEGKEPPL